MAGKDFAKKTIKDVADYNSALGKYSKITKKGYTPHYFPNTGVEFEHLMIRLFEMSGLNVCYSLINKKRVLCQYCNRTKEQIVEQIDGVVYLDSIPFIIESKFHEEEDIKNNIEPVAKLYSRLQIRPSFAMGMIITNTGFTDPAVEYMKYLQPKNILLWQGTEIPDSINACINGKSDFKKLLQWKMNNLIENGINDRHVKGLL